MHVRLADIQEEGLELKFWEAPQKLDLVYPDTAFEGDVRIQARLTRVEETIIVSGTVRAVLILECGRCTQSFSYPVHRDVKTAFNPKTAGKDLSGKDHELSSEEQGLYFYSGQTIDLGECIREQILLVLPMVPLCRADCKGLCSNCGQDRNLGDCGCAGEEGYGSSET